MPQAGTTKNLWTEIVSVQTSLFHHVTFYVCMNEMVMNKMMSIPVEETNDQVMRQLKQKIPLGTHKVDNLIPLQVFEKVSIRDGIIVHEKVTIVVWKIPFEEIRNEFIKKNYICMWLQTNGESKKKVYQIN